MSVLNHPLPNQPPSIEPSTLAKANGLPDHLLNLKASNPPKTKMIHTLKKLALLTSREETAELNPPNAQEILATYIYDPAAHRPDKNEELEDTTLPHDNTITPPSLSSLLWYAAEYLSTLLTSLSSPEPDIIEFSDEEIRQKSNMRFEVQVVELEGGKRVVRMFMLVRTFAGGERRVQVRGRGSEW